MKKALHLFALSVCLFVLLLASCDQNPLVVNRTPAIRGNVTLPAGTDIKGSDFYIRIMEGETAVYTGKVNADGSFVVEGLDETKTYSILLSTEELGEINTSSRDVSRATTTSGYGGWLRNVTASIDEQAGVGSVKVKPLGTIKGKVKRSGETEHYDIMVYIPGTSYMAVTDTDGNYSIFNVPQSTTAYNLRCISLTGDWLPESITGVLLYTDSDTENPVKTVADKTIVKNAGTLLGTITKPGASDNSNIIVLVENNEFSETGTTTTDGSLQITGILPGTYKVSISSTGYVTKVINDVLIKASKDTSIGEISLVANGGDIIGSISLSDGASKAGVLITAKSSDEKYSYTTSSDSDGKFILADVYPATYTVSFTKAGYADALRNSIKVSSGDSINLGVVSISSEFGALTGRVVDSNGNPVSGVSVMIGDVSTVTTRDNGVFEKSGLAVGIYSLSISKYGYHDQTIENIAIHSSHTTELEDDITIIPLTGRISGKVEKDGTSDYFGVIVTISGNGRSFSTMTDSTGHYSIDATPGVYNTIDFSCGCWSAQYSLQSQILLSVDDEVSIPDYKLISHHSLGLFESKASTCVEAGYEKYRCWNCGYEKTVDLPLKDHSLSLTDHLDPTCTDDGWRKYECSICGQSFTETDPAKGHDWGKPVLLEAATCHSSGRQEVTCRTCGVTGIQTIDMLPHAWEDNGYHDGHIEYICSTCGESEYAEDSTAILNISDWGSVSLKPSVNPDSVKTLIIPSEIDGITVTSVFEHTFQDCVNITKVILPDTLTSIESWAFAGCIGLTEIDLPASLTRIGDQAFRGCTSLKAIVIPDGIERIEYSTFYNCESLVSVALPDSVTYLDRECFVGCGFDRFQIPETVDTLSCYVFMNCRNLKEILIPRSVKYIDDRPFWDCTSLEKIYVQSQTQPSGWITSWHDCCDAQIVWGYTGELHYTHTESTEWKTSSSYHWHECTECGEVISMGKHEYTDEITKQPTCTETGVRTYTCSVCGWSYTESVPALGHDYHSEITKQATCSEKGEITYSCSRCDSSYTEEIVSHHEYEEQITIAATCTTDGLKTLTCSLCGDTKTEVIPATGHSYKETVIPATCTEDGTTIHRCEICGDSYEETIEATGHNYVASITKQANCEEDGIKTFVCSHCSDTYTETIKAYGHYFTTSTVVQPATCYETGIKSSKCFRCGKTVTEEIPKLEHDPIFAADEANHWTQCSLCGAILVPKETHTFIETEGDFVCKDCGYSDSSLYYQVDDNGVLTPKDKSVLPTILRIPSNIGGKAVTSIGDRAFANCSGIEGVYISEGIIRIGNDAFDSCGNLKTVYLPNGLEYIGSAVFYNDGELREVIIPDSVTVIESSAFSGCGLKTIVIPNNVITLGHQMFRYNTQLESVSIPNSIKEIPFGLFDLDSSLTTIIFGGTIAEWNSLKKGDSWRNVVPASSVICSDGTVELGNYDVSSDGVFTIMDRSAVPSVFEVPSEVDGITVTKIGVDAFSGCDNLVTLILPDTVRDLYSYSICNCSNLKEIIGTEYLTHITGSALDGNNSLEYLYIPNVENWDRGEWGSSWGTCGIKSLTISNKLQKLPRLDGFINLEEIVFLGTISQWKRLSKEGDWRSSIPATVVKCSDGDYDLSSDMYSITRDGVLSVTLSSSLPASVDIPSTVDGITVKELGSRSFYNCSQLTSVVIPSTVNRIGSDAFAWCQSLTHVEIPQSVKTILNTAFYFCTSLSEIVIPDSVTSIGTVAFESTALVSFEMPDSIKELGHGVFNNCTSLESVVISGNIEELSHGLFQGCSNLISIMFRGTISKWNSLPKDDSWNSGVPAEYVVCLDGVVYIKEGVYTVDDDGILYCSDYSKLTSEVVIPAYVGNKKVEGLAKDLFKGRNITSVTISEGITSIGESCFANCTKLESVSLPSSLITIWHNAFDGCSSLKSIVIPSSVENLHGSAFSGCTSLSSVTLPTALTYLSGAVFGGCTSLKTLEIPSNIEDIHWGAFVGAGFTSIDIPNTVKYIRDGAFENCGSLESISISKNITEIPAGLFKNCQSLRTIQFKGTVAEWNALLKGEDWNTGVSVERIICSDGIISSYFQINDEGIISLTQDIPTPSELEIPSSVNGTTVKAIADNAFKDCKTITKITIPTSIQSIGTYAFNGCDNLESIVYLGTSNQWKSINKPEYWVDDVRFKTLVCADRTFRLEVLNKNLLTFSYSWIPSTTTYSVEFFMRFDSPIEDYGITVYYTTDGSVPSKDSQVYDGAFVVEEEGLVMYLAVLDYDYSSISSEVRLPEVPSFTNGPAGGWIVYDKGEYSNGWRYLEVAPYDLVVINGVPTLDTSGAYINTHTEGVNYFIMGYGKDPNTGNVILSETGTDIGTGYENTQNLYAARGEVVFESLETNETTELFAAKLVSDLSYGGYDDWFIPSRDEWECVRSAVGVYGIASFGKENRYWSSSEFPRSNGDVAYSTVKPSVSFNQGNGAEANALFRVRPMRRF